MSERQVTEFMAAAGQLPKPRELEEERRIIALRISLIDEEYDELIEALNWGERSIIAKELADIVYVAIGTAIALEIPFDTVFDLVHDANMSKFNEDAVLREDGKVLKGPGYQGPEAEIERLLK